MVTAVARRHGCRPQQVHDWRRLARQGLLDAPGVAREVEPAPFVPLIADSMTPTPPDKERAISIEIEGAVVHVRGPIPFWSGVVGRRLDRSLRGAAQEPLMLTPPASLMIYVATQPVDFRKGAEGLALLAKETLGHDPMKGVAVVFRAKRGDRVKIVVWDGSGLVLYWKRLDGSGFKWPPIVAGVMRMNAAQLSALLAGMDWTRMHRASDPAAEGACVIKIFAASGREAWQTRANE